MGRHHNNQLVEINIFDEPEDKHDHPAQHTSRTSTEGFVIKEETPEKKRKHDEINKIKTLHHQPVVDSARAADMDHIHFSETFPGFDYTSYHNNNHSASYHPNVFNPPMHPVNGGRTFYDDGSFYSNSMPVSSNLARSLSGDTLVPESFVPGSFGGTEPLYTGGVDSFTSTSFGAAESSHPGGVGSFIPGSFGVAEQTYPTGIDAFAPDHIDMADDRHEDFKQENIQEHYSVSATPAEDSDFVVSEAEDERPRKTPKLNKDGVPRKPRQPRPKLLKWSDDDWKNVCLGIVWACGETGVQIPFEQAAQVVGEKCTAGAMQQALLKLRGKQIDAGHQIPNLKMAWTRKNKHAASGAKATASVEPEANKPRKKPTRMEATQSLIVTLPRAYTDRDRGGLMHPYKWKKPPRKIRSANIKQDEFPYTSDYLPATPTGRHFYNTPLVTPFGNNIGYLHGMILGGGEYANLLTTEGFHDLGNGFGDSADDVFGA